MGDVALDRDSRKYIHITANQHIKTYDKANNNKMNHTIIPY